MGCHSTGLVLAYLVTQIAVAWQAQRSWGPWRRMQYVTDKLKEMSNLFHSLLYNCAFSRSPHCFLLTRSSHMSVESASFVTYLTEYKMFMLMMLWFGCHRITSAAMRRSRRRNSKCVEKWMAPMSNFQRSLSMLFWISFEHSPMSFPNSVNLRPFRV